MRISSGTLDRVNENDIVDGRFEIPEGITLGNYELRGFTNLRDLTISKKVRIGKGAFSGCTSLTELMIPEGTYVGTNAFSGCVGLKSLTLPEEVDIDCSAFYGCTGLTELVMPEGMIIPPGAFSACSALKSITIPEKATIYHSAFSGCTGLTSVTLPEGLEALGVDAFDGCSSLDYIYVYSSDEGEINRIRGLLPAELQDKCVAHPLYEKIEASRKQALEKLCLEPKTSNIFSNRYKGILERLPDIALSDISSFLGQDSRYYREAEREMRGQPLPSLEEDLTTYQTTLGTIADQYAQLAREHKKYPHERKQDMDSEETKADKPDNTGPGI